MRVGRGLEIPDREIEVRTSRSSGPGGQHANVTASRVEAVFDVASSSALSDEQKRRVMAKCGPRVTAVAQESRGQARNRQLALERLAARIDHALQVPRARRATKPTRASRERRLDAKRRAGDRKAQRRKPGLDP